MPDPTQPKLRSYCAALYDHFLAESSVDEETGYAIWRGHITKAARTVGIPEGTYKRVTDALHDLHCIEQIERGFRGNARSVVILHRAPTDEVWDASESGRKPLTRPEAPAILSRRVDELERRLEGLDIKQALVDLQQQITKLRRQQESLQHPSQ